MADCAAAPALSYANRVMPFAETHPHAFAYLERLRQRPSFAHALRDAAPYERNFPTRYQTLPSG
jgi:glutathione S-transferase